MADGAASTLRLDTVTNQQHTVIIVRGDVDANTAPQLCAVVDTLSAETSVIELDFSELRFLDSTGLSAIVAALNRLDQVGGELRLSQVPGLVHQLLEITDLLRFVTVVSRRD